MGLDTKSCWHACSMSGLTFLNRSYNQHAFHRTVCHVMMPVAAARPERLPGDHQLVPHSVVDDVLRTDQHRDSAASLTVYLLAPHALEEFGKYAYSFDAGDRCVGQVFIWGRSVLFWRWQFWSGCFGGGRFGGGSWCLGASCLANVTVRYLTFLTL